MADTKGSAQIKPSSVLTNFKISLSNANWITPADLTTVAMAERLARLIDTLFDLGDPDKQIPALTSRLSACMNDLHMTPMSRKEVKKAVEEVTGENYTNDFIRLAYSKTPNKTSPKPAQRRKTTGTTGK